MVINTFNDKRWLVLLLASLSLIATLWHINQVTFQTEQYSLSVPFISSPITIDANTSNISILDIYEERQIKRRQRLQKLLDNVDWKPYEQIVEDNGILPFPLLRNYWDIATTYLDDDSYLPPLKVTRRPTPLTFPLNCQDNQFFARQVLTGEPRETSARVIDVFPFSYELDVLEMRLYELDDVVDYFVLIESMATHRGTPKPLGFARNQERFVPFAEKIIHLVLDDADMLSMRPDENEHVDVSFWTIDKEQRRLAVKKFVQHFGPFNETDIVIIGDADEIPHAVHLNVLKHCIPVTTNFPVAFGSSHSYRYTFNWIVTRYGIAVPVVYMGGHANEIVTNNLGNFRDEATGKGRTVYNDISTHCTTFGDVMTAFLKHISISEGRSRVPLGDVHLLSHPFEYEAQSVGIGIHLGQDPHGSNDRNTDLGWVGPVLCREDFIRQYGDAQLPYIPWVVEANPKRFAMYMNWTCPLPGAVN